ncbi:MAG TPA: (2Fe-2S)-binding protein [Methylibium sp.]|uniref:(2Fe-2S)-binding protein n=1 Tax=Methylibium sp. TaxID=2067992 RepID=UPI002DBD322E|nr:(2Fe-2S)-binding protein [Methylibium sp.]HEU4459060.1 (2Fe-2S)-binding protein [Methylibium sp.]
MIVCVCHRVSDRDIRRQAQACSSFDELQVETGVSTACGRCGDCAQAVFHEARHGGLPRTAIAILECRAAPQLAA